MLIDGILFDSTLWYKFVNPFFCFTVEHRISEYRSVLPQNLKEEKVVEKWLILGT
jgi:hypothetical protein